MSLFNRDQGVRPAVVLLKHLLKAAAVFAVLLKLVLG
jgi:hypothetical protein